MQRRVWIAIGISLATHAALAAVISSHTLTRLTRVEVARGDEASSRLRIGIVSIPANEDIIFEPSPEREALPEPVLRADVEAIAFEAPVEPPARVAAHRPDDAPQQPPASETDLDEPDGRDGPPTAASAAPGITQEARPRVEHNAPPVYPAVARRRGWEGTVLLELRVLADGRVAEVSVANSSGHETLDEAAVRAVRQWRFEPALCLGKPVAATARLPIRFRLIGP